MIYLVLGTWFYEHPNCTNSDILSSSVKCTFDKLSYKSLWIKAYMLNALNVNFIVVVENRSGYTVSFSCITHSAFCIREV